MLQYRAIQNLQNLSKKELSELNKWLRPAWANSNKKLFELFEVLRGFYPTFASQKLTLQHLYKKLYPTKAYKEKELLNLLSKLSLAIEDFLVHQHLRGNSELYASILLGVKKLRPISKDKDSKQIDNQILNLEKKTVKTVVDLQELIRLNKIKAATINPKSGDTDKKSFLLQVEKYLDQYYSISKARNAMELLEREKKFGEKNDRTSWYEEIPVQCRSLPAVLFYEEYEKAGNTINQEQFKQLQKLFFQIYDQINLKDQRNIYLLLANSAARITSNRGTEIFQDLIELNQLAIREGFILDNNLITPHSYANVINVACQQSQFAFAKGFLESHTQFLPPNMQRDGKDWGRLFIDYKQKASGTFQEVKNLDKHTRAYTVFSLRIRLLVTQILFDAYQKDLYQADDRFEFHVEAFERKLIREKKYPKKHLEGLKIFHKYCKTLAGYFPTFRLTEAEADHLRNEINRERRIYAKPWLMNKIAEMEKGDHY